MTTRTMIGSMVLLAAVTLAAGHAWGIGGILGQSKAELKLRYDLTVSPPGNGQVAVELALDDDGRLKPIGAVELMIPREDGSGYYDLTAPLALREADGRRVVRFNLKTEWATRAQVWLTTTTFDGKHVVGMERVHYVIRIADAMKQPAPVPPAAPAAPAAPGALAAPAAPAATPPPAAGRSPSR